MAQAWHYENSGQRFGPISTNELKAKACAGELLPSDLIWREGMKEWKPARFAKGLFPESIPIPSVLEKSSVVSPLGINESRSVADHASDTATQAASIAPEKFSFKETAIAAAKFGAAHAERAKLLNVTLPQQYLALGRHCLNSSDIQAEFSELTLKLNDIQSEITRLKDHEASKASSISEKARAAADYAVRSAHKAKLTFEHSSLLSTLGKAVYDKHGVSGGPENVTAPIQTSLSRIESLDDQIVTLSQSKSESWLTPSRFLIAALLLLAFGGHWTWQMMMSSSKTVPIPLSLSRQTSLDNQTATLPQSSNNNWLVPSQILITAVLLLALGGLWRLRMRMSQGSKAAKKIPLSLIESRDSLTATLSKSSNNSWLTPSRILITAMVLLALSGFWGWRTIVSPRNNAIIATVEVPAQVPAQGSAQGSAQGPAEEKPDRHKQVNEEISISSGDDIAKFASKKFPPNYFEKGPNGEKIVVDEATYCSERYYLNSIGKKISHGISKCRVVYAGEMLGQFRIDRYALHDEDKLVASIEITDEGKPIKIVSGKTNDRFSDDQYFYKKDDVIHIRADYRMEGEKKIPLFHPFRVDNPAPQRIHGRSVSIQVSEDPNHEVHIRYFNPSIIKQKCFIDGNQVNVVFDVDLGKWYEMNPVFQLGLRFRFFDKAGNYISHFYTKERFCANFETFVVKSERFMMQQKILEKNNLPEKMRVIFPTLLFPSNNVLAYTIDEIMAKKTEIVELSFFQHEFN